MCGCSANEEAGRNVLAYDSKALAENALCDQQKGKVKQLSTIEYGKYDFLMVAMALGIWIEWVNQYFLEG